ncbi:hypothetical protein D3C81_1728780 [compost metagenome]
MRLGAELAEVELQGVALGEAEVRQLSELVLQDGNEVQVQLDHIELGAAGQQALGEGALAWADFQQVLARTGVDAAQDAVDHACIVQEVLAEALARAVLVFGHGTAPSFRLQASSKSVKRKCKVAKLISCGRTRHADWLAACSLQLAACSLQRQRLLAAIW